MTRMTVVAVAAYVGGLLSVFGAMGLLTYVARKSGL